MKMRKDQSFIKYLDFLMLKYKLSPNQLSRALHVSPGAIWRWRMGRGMPTRAMKARIKHWGEIGDLSEAYVKGTFAVRVLKARARFGLTQEQLANELELTNTTINRWEMGLTQPSALHEEKFNKWEKGRGLEKEEREEKEEKVFKKPDLKSKIKLIKKEEFKVQLPELEDVFDDFGKQKAPWEYPIGHPKRRVYDEKRRGI